MKCCTVKWLGSAVLQLYTAVAYSSLDHNCVARANESAINGHHSIHKGLVCEWLGIPYAQAPVGNLRFAPPAEPLLPQDSFDADSYVSDMSKAVRL